MKARKNKGLFKIERSKTQKAHQGTARYSKAQQSTAKHGKAR